MAIFSMAIIIFPKVVSILGETGFGQNCDLQGPTKTKFSSFSRMANIIQFPKIIPRERDSRALLSVKRDAPHKRGVRQGGSRPSITRLTTRTGRPTGPDPPSFHPSAGRNHCDNRSVKGQCDGMTTVTACVFTIPSNRGRRIETVSRVSQDRLSSLAGPFIESRRLAGPFIESRRTVYRVSQDHFSSLAGPYLESPKTVSRVPQDRISSLAGPYLESRRTVYRVSQDRLSSLTEPFLESRRTVYRVSQDRISSLAGPYLESRRTVSRVSQDSISSLAGPYLESPRTVSRVSQDRLLSLPGPYLESPRTVSRVSQDRISSRGRDRSLLGHPLTTRQTSVSWLRVAQHQQERVMGISSNDQPDSSCIL